MQPINYRDRPVAIASADRFWLTDEIETLPQGHPLRTWACWMCLYARDVLTGRLPGPYTPLKAELFARSALLPEDDIRARAALNDRTLAEHFNVPLEQIAERRSEILKCT